MQISKTTGGTFHRAQDADQLNTALARLPAAFMIVCKPIDIASWFAADGGLLIRRRGSALAVVEPHQADARPGEHRGSLPPGR
jgi:hypothetical protein